MSDTLTKLQQIQTILGVKPDGIWGSKSEAALEAAIAAGHPEVPGGSEGGGSRMEASGGARRWPREAEAASFYGNSDGSSGWEAAHLVTFDAPYALYMDGQLVRRIRCHKLVKDSLLLILTKILALYKTPEVIHAVGLDQYDGCYNFRNVRGASHLSMHSYGAAIDFDAAHNPLGATTGRMPPEVVAIFKAEGWRWGGDYSGRKDWMHFEACT
jgi:hypothetical protein